MEIKIVRSERRASTVSARVVAGQMEVRAPATMSDAELQPVIEKFKQRFEKRRIKRSLDDAVLRQRAHDLNRQHFAGKLVWRSIAWSAGQEQRWGSCTPENGTIRLSHRLAGVPEWVCDYVLMHELAHLLEANHGPRFWALVNRYPRAERARGYLMALAGEEAEEAM